MFNKHDYEISTKTNIYTTAKSIPAFKQKFSMRKLMQNWGGKSRQNLANHGIFEKAKQLTFTQGLKQLERYLEVDKQMTMISDDNGVDSLSVRTFSPSECQYNPRQNRLLSCLFTEESIAQNR